MGYVESYKLRKGEEVKYLSGARRTVENQTSRPLKAKPRNQIAQNQNPKEYLKFKSKLL